MAIQYDPRLQGKQNTTDILSGQEDASQQPQDGSQTPQQPAPNAQAAPAPANAPQSNLATKMPKSSSSSGMFTNINQYAEKNKPAAQNMAKSIGNTVQRSADIARKNIQATQNQFGNLMEQGTLANRENAVTDVTSAAQRAAGMSAPQQVQAGQATDGERAATGAAPQVQMATQDQSNQSASDQRIKSILDAQYGGPQRLQDIGSFGESQRRAEEAQRLTEQLTGGNRQELLDKSLERQGSSYSQGSRRLDELLFGQGDPQRILQQRQQEIGDVGQDLTSASQTARTDAINRASEISGIRDEARQALQNVATGRATEVDKAIADQIASGGNLADYYRDVLSGAEGGLDLGTLEAQTLGVQSGAGLYNLLRDETQREALLGNLDARDSLKESQIISKDQQAQLAELQRLAQLSGDYNVADSGLNFASKFQDADQAGTQTALDALNLDSFGDALTEAEKNFRSQAARDVTGVGRGKAKYNKGFGRGRGKVKKTAYQSANLKDILEEQGYDFESDPSQYVSETDPSLLANLSNIASQASGENIDVSDAGNFIDTMSDIPAELLGGLGINTNDPMGQSLEAGMKAGLATLNPALGTTVAGTNLGGAIAESLGSDLERARLFGDAGALVGRGVKDIGREVQGAVSGLFGGGKGDAKKKAAAKAQRAALADLQRKLTGKLSSSGFSNRVNVADTEESQARQRQLLDILGGIRNK